MNEKKQEENTTIKSKIEQDTNNQYNTLMITFYHIQTNHEWLYNQMIQMILYYDDESFRHLVQQINVKNKYKRHSKEYGIHLSIKMTETRWRVHHVRN